MPDLSLAALHTLLAAPTGEADPTRLHLAHDGERLQPLLGLYPSSAPIRAHLAAAVERGERRLQSWLASQPYQAVPLDPLAIRNVNRPQADQPIDSPSASTTR
jgi:molybdopterin-guanine dinucleotide biosynthesis protein A